jgi:hypothetical protein
MAHRQRDPIDGPNTRRHHAPDESLHALVRVTTCENWHGHD